MENITKGLIKTLKKFKKKKLFVHEPDIRTKDFSYLKDCIDKNEVSTVGSYVNSFEKKNFQYNKSKKRNSY